MAKKATAHDAELVLKLYDLRREAEMRKARSWFGAEFWPQSAADILKVASAFPSQENAWLRQVASYWDMVAPRAARHAQPGALSGAWLQRRNVFHFR